jgi:UDP-2-acetamido-2-deoxy-ribo-hexuluronate aminotransferase
MTIPFVDLKAEYRRLKPRIAARIDAVLEHAQFIMGPEIVELEKTLAAYTGSRHCIGVSDGTTALLIALMALDVKAGDEVITTPFTFIATGEMIALIGAKPVFVDIDRRSYNIDPGQIERAVTPKTRAIMPVSLFGQCADMDAINAIAARHKLPVIEDAAQSFGAAYKDRKSCALSTIATTSFFPSKPLGCYGDGGACFTDDDALADRMRQIRMHGQSERYVHPVIGLNGRLDTLQAAVLLAKMETFEEDIERRVQAAERYDRLLKGILATPYIEPFNRSAYAQYTIEVDDRDKVQAKMQASGVPTAVHYPIPLHRQPAFDNLAIRAGSLPNSEAAAERVMSVPMHPYLDEATQRRIVAALRDALPQAPRAIRA